MSGYGAMPRPRKEAVRGGDEGAEPPSGPWSIPWREDRVGGTRGDQDPNLGTPVVNCVTLSR